MEDVGKVAIRWWETEEGMLNLLPRPGYVFYDQT
jgi:hypothetical protein